MKDNVYLDNAATTWPKPEVVYTFMDSFFRSHGVNPGRSGHTLAVEAEQLIVDTRRLLAGFFGFTGDPARVVFSLNSTDALNQAIMGLVAAGDHVVTTRLEHNAVLRVTQHAVRDDGLEVSWVTPETSGYVDVNAIADAIKPNTRAIVLNHASNVLGTVQPLQEVADLAKLHDLVLIVDSAQTAGVLPVDMQTLGRCIMTFTGHKGLFGPMGIGGLVVHPDVELKPLRVGGTGVDSLSTYQPEAYPNVLEAGTQSLPGIAGLHAAQGWFRELGRQQQLLNGHEDSAALEEHELITLAVNHVHAVEMQQLQRLESHLESFECVRMLGKPRADARVAVMSFMVDGMPTQQVADMLDADHHICVRAGMHCAPLVHVDANTADEGGAIRLSPGYFTDDEDIEQCLEALSDILG